MLPPYTLCAYLALCPLEREVADPTLRAPGARISQMMRTSFLMATQNSVLSRPPDLSESRTFVNKHASRVLRFS